MPVLSDPRAGFKAAPVSLKVAYISMVVQALGVFLLSLTGGRLFGGTGFAWFWVIPLVILAYLVFDSASVILKARPMARWLTLIFSALSMGVFLANLLSSGDAPSWAFISSGFFILAGLLAIVCVFLPTSRNQFDQHRSEDVTAVAREMTQGRKASSRSAQPSREEAKKAAVDAAVAKFGPGVAEKAAELADKVLDGKIGNNVEAASTGTATESSSELDTAALNRAQRRAMEKAKRTGKAPKIVQKQRR